MADITVYIPDIPVDVDDEELEEQIKTRLKTGHHLDVQSVKCYSTLGVAVINMLNEDDKHYLITELETTVLSKNSGTNITFVEELELDSYIVIGSELKKALSADEVAQRYANAYKTSKTRRCEIVSDQFPNVFRICYKQLAELIQAASSPDFRIEAAFATVYPRADCCFFEDLPTNTNNEKLLSAIAAQLGEPSLHKTSLYTQYNKQTGNAIVIASKSLRKWTKEATLKIDEHSISKKHKLSYRVLISPVHNDTEVEKILHHKLFYNRVASHKRVNDKLIIELNDINHFHECLDIGGFGIDGKALAIKPHTRVTDPDSCELDALNWYDTDMLDIKPDITTIINDHQHPIFRFKWNAESFLEQMNKAAAIPGKGYDLTRHLLRVTVMLNTIATLRKKQYIVDDTLVKLKLERIQTIGYNHQSKLFTRKTLSQTDFQTPYPKTTVQVVEEDCLVLYEQLVAKGHRPLLLNMANATSPGGGYRKGDGAQEENIFRRSDYYHSLDGELADRTRSERHYYTPKGELKQLKGFGDFYPMEEFGGIYTAGITVFRGTEQDGYPYKKQPLYNVCAIAMAAYRDPPLTPDNKLQNKSAMNTRRKIENIFGIAHHQKHDCLVLSALGCGAFRNPPEHVALLFKSVILQYAGYFDTIYFAIINDHNAKGVVNPKGNYGPFKAILDGFQVEPPKTLRVDGVSGPYRVLDKTADGQLILDDVIISQAAPCQHGNNCRDIRTKDHSQQFSHPPRCPLQKANSQCEHMNDDVHLATFMHTKKCEKGGECTSTDAAHLNDFDHPDFCKDQSHCYNTDPQHLFDYRHLPACQDGIDCPLIWSRDDNHIKAFRHVKLVCPEDNCCSQIHDESHMRKTIHSFREPCPFTPYSCALFVEFFQPGKMKRCSSEAEQHCLQFAHLCPYGRQCKTDEDKHYETTIHIARQLCPQSDQCPKITNEDHLESFAHPGIRDIRLLCQHPGYKCHSRSDKKHSTTYRHGQNYDHLTVAPCSNYNADIDFARNQRHLIRNVNNYIETEGWTNKKVRSELRNWIRALQPVHRCRQEIFESILVHGHVMSRKYMEKLNRPSSVAKAVLQHNDVRSIILKHNNPATKNNAYKLVKTLVIDELVKTGTYVMTTPDPDHQEEKKIAERRLKTALSDHDMKVIYDSATNIAQASIKLHSTPAGIGFGVDVIMETDRHVFSILGPHLGYYYGDIVIIFKQEIMFHPDSNFSIQAATSFKSGRTYGCRPWIPNQTADNERIADFHHSKLHCSVPRYEYAAVTELAALTDLTTKSMDADINDNLSRWKRVDSHETFEAHLPQLIPLDYIESVYMPQNIFDSLTPEAQSSAKRLFKDSLIMYPHPVDLTLLKPGSTVPLDTTRRPYLKFIVDEILKQIQERMNTPHISRGIVVTASSSNYDEHIVLPMTIKQSYELYRLDNDKAPERPRYTLIYWQAMHGDMMLTIANEKIQPTEDQPHLRCLVCYVAEKPSTATSRYHENYSYLNDGHPFEHSTNVSTAKFRAKSHVFYRGCNTDDFLTFCLEIDYKTNEARLFHAGANGIYNHEKIAYKFDKSELDLSRIEYVHVSAGSQDVPIRNLRIHHERIDELHPTSDKDFGINTSELIRKRRSSVDHIAPRHHHPDAAKERHDVYPKPPKTRPASVKTPQKKMGLFKKIKCMLFGTVTVDQKQVAQAAAYTEHSSDVPTTDTPEYDQPRDERVESKPQRGRPPSPKRNSSRSRSPSPKARPPPRPRTPPLHSSKLPLCRDSIYCLNQNVRTHTDEFSHICRFNDQCRKQADEPHLVHQNHKVPRCTDDRDCREKADPVHRAQYRHRGLPDLLMACQYQELCYDKSDEHRLRYFHGEEIPSFKKHKPLAPVIASTRPRAVIPCKFGNDCRNKNDPKHSATYSHPT